MTTLFESDGIIVYVQDGIIHEVTAADDYQIEDTEQNRLDVVADAINTVKEWEY